MVLLRGEVRSGVGDLAMRMRQYSDRYKEATGVSLFPGSLNVHLPDPWPLPDGTMTLPPEDVGRLVHLLPCTVSGLSCFIFRTDNAERAGPDEQRIVELLAEVRLRDALDLADGDEIEIAVGEHT